VDPGLFNQREQGMGRQSDAAFMVQQRLVRDAEGLGQGRDAMWSEKLHADLSDAFGKLRLGSRTVALFAPR
jgi:hypothetical protein